MLIDHSRYFVSKINTFKVYLFSMVMVFFTCDLRAQDGSISPLPERKEGKYTWKKNHDPNGIGKFYLGREIAWVMGHQGASWLERPEREKEERPDKLLEILKIKQGMVIADIGAGSGYYTFRMSPKVGDKGKILAVDIQKEMIAILDKKIKDKNIKNVETIQSNEKDPKLPDGKLDLILMVDVYHEFNYPFEMVEKLIKALKVGGKLVFVEFRLEDQNVPILLVHKMSERQVIREMDQFKQLKHVETQKSLPWQHVMFFEKIVPTKKK